MALTGVLRPGYIQIRVIDIQAALTHYIDRLGLHEVSREADGRVYLRAWDEFDRHSVILRPADMPGMGLCRLQSGERAPAQRSRKADYGGRHESRGDPGWRAARP
jgi:catechol 2,3-dioxygenase